MRGVVYKQKKGLRSCLSFPAPRRCKEGNRGVYLATVFERILGSYRWEGWPKNRKRGFGIVSHSRTHRATRRGTEEDERQLYHNRFRVAKVWRGGFKEEKDSDLSPIRGGKEKKREKKRRINGYCIRTDLR